MSKFNMSSWMRKQYITEAGLDSPTSKKLADAMNSAMEEIDSEMSYKDFAIAVADVLKNEYGEHVYDMWMGVLHSELGYGESKEDK
jgi:hypothetical protein|tara:strand:- start:32 stop:289 length:258 start_codon:yes stop_codon:yes gene_type:complete